MNSVVISTVIGFAIIASTINFVSAEEYIVSIPFGAYNPELNTPTEVWFDPPIISVQVGDQVIWENDDKEMHVITSGKGSGRFGWMSKNFGTPDGYFASERFEPGDSWSFVFDKAGAFEYYCSIHPWMEGVILVQQTIPDFPQDSSGNIIEEFPLLRYTPDKMIEVNLTWEPHVVVTHEKVKFIYQFYDPQTNSNLAKMSYDFVVIQNGKEIYRDSGINQIGGDFRNFAFDESGPAIIRFEGIKSSSIITEESTSVASQSTKDQRTVEFSTLVYLNPEKISHEEFHIKPAQRLEFYYELAMAIILVPAGIFVAIIFWMKKKPNINTKSTPV